ncbi:MAG: lipopolysaccharide biosynthesis protein [Syntrophales bacterium]|nr:lipopolysaccharide biosynthesis protein [Syntrophales bacterium]
MIVTDRQALSQKAISGGLWLLALRVSTRFLGLIRSIILARLLTPADFGLVGMAMIVIAVLDIVTQTGFDATLIQRKEPSRNLIDAAWTLQAIRGGFLFLAAFLIAPWAAHFFHLSSLDLVIRFIAISFIITGIRNVGVVFFQKELRFDQSFKLEIISSLVDLFLSVGLALILRDVWALLWGGLAGNLSRFILSYLIHPYRPTLSFSPQHVKSLFNFGKWILGTGIVYALQVQIDIFAIGKIRGAKDVGLYQMAMTIATIATTEISYLIRQVTFPTFSILQDDMEGLKRAYVKVCQLASAISLPIGLLILALADDIVFVLLGHQWMNLIPCLKVLVISGLLATIGRLAYPVFLALGLPKYEALFQGFNLIVIALLIFPLTHMHGIIGAAWALLAGNVSVFLSSLILLKRLANLSYFLHLKILLPPIVSVTFMTTTLLILKPHMTDMGIFLRLSTEIITGLFIYALSLHIFGVKIGMDLIKFSLKRISSLFKVK